MNRLGLVLAALLFSAAALLSGAVAQAEPVCVGGPAGRLSFVLRDAAEAQTCVKAGNDKPVANDEAAPSPAKLQTWPCQCTKPKFTDPTTCRRWNPTKPGAPAVLTNCKKG